MNPASHLSHGPRRPARWVAAAGAALVAALAPALPAGAASGGVLPLDTEDVITWGVKPADADGPDGRSRVELVLDPGASASEHLAVSNFSDVPVTFSIQAADGYINPKGRFNMLPSDRESTGAGTWIEVQDSVEVAPDATVVVPFTVTVPDNATPGDHVAGIAATMTSTGAGEGGTSVGVESRVGFRVSTRVTGDVEPVLTVENVKASYTPSWNPFAAGDMTVSYDVTNDGNVRLGADGDVATSGFFGLLSTDGSATQIPEVLPGGSQRSRVETPNVWPLGPVRSTITVTPTVVDDDQVDAPLDPVTVTVTTWAIPWPQLLLVAIVVVLVVGVRDDRRRRRQRLEAMLAKARDEGRQQASGSEPAPSGTGATAAKGEPKA
ncbi:WxL protein peptidoglycan domain-containing protein [Cellulosimicrobium sp. NPDC055967]|uniref:WxL protein peptidoglycan domain-containing protein n=1 Tax=Cellulosimicrobium sp. NPDC055967 TaxID=3345670 RepID=UPI0035DBEC45